MASVLFFGPKRKGIENDGIPDVTKKQKVYGVKEEGLKRKLVENDGIHGDIKKKRDCGVEEEGDGRRLLEDVGNNLGNHRGSQGAASTNFGNAGFSQEAITYNPGQFGERSVAIQVPTLGNTEVAARMDAIGKEMKAYMYNPD